MKKKTGGRWLGDAPQKVKCPVLLLGSRKDTQIPDIEKDFKQLYSQISDCRFVFAEKGDHPLIWTNTAFYNDEALKFLGV